MSHYEYALEAQRTFVHARDSICAYDSLNLNSVYTSSSTKHKYHKD